MINEHSKSLNKHTNWSPSLYLNDVQYITGLRFTLTSLTITQQGLLIT